jgi:uncharacterized protein involved in exopolysaccharide biosynthesis
MNDHKQSERSLRDIVELVREHQGKLLLFVISAMLSSLAITFIFSEKFRAATLVSYRPTDTIEVQPNAVVPDKTALGFPVPTLPFQAVGATIERVGKSERVLRRVVENLGLDQPPQNTSQGLAWYFQEIKSRVKDGLGKSWDILKFGRVIKEDPTTDAIIGLMKYVTIESREDYTSTVIVVDKYPDRAAVIVDEIGRVLVEEIKKLSSEAAQERSVELTRRLEAKDKELQAVRSEIERIKIEWGFHVLDAEMALHLESLEEFQNQLLANELNLSEARATVEALAMQRSELEPTVTSSTTVKDDPLHGELKAQLARYVVDRKGLLQRRGPNHIDVKAISEKIKDVESQSAALEEKRVSDEVAGTNATYEAVLLEEVSAKARLDGLVATNVVLKENIRKIQERLIPPNIVSKMESLELSQKTFEDDYLHLAAALEEAKTTELAEVPEVRVLFPATPIKKPIKPIRIYHVALSGILAVSLGIAFIFITDFVATLWNVPITLLAAPTSNIQASKGA